MLMAFWDVMLQTRGEFDEPSIEAFDIDSYIHRS